MANSRMSKALHHLRRAVLVRDGANRTDGQLLADYVNRHDRAALAALVRRHGPMVWGVCRRVVRNHHDSEDAFQATFLVLVRRAASIASPELLANWLYAVAHQTALKARATTARRRARERQVTEVPEPAVAEPDLGHDLQPLLDQELSRLPDMYRVAIILCDLEGRTRREAARLLGVPDGTLAARLARGRVMLAKRLARHGLAVSGGSLAAVLAQNAARASVPISVASFTIKTATQLAAGQAATVGRISADVAALTEGVATSMFPSRIKTILATLVIAALVGGIGVICQTQAGGPSPGRPAAQSKPDKGKPPAARKGEKLRPDMQRLQGSWTIVSSIHDGYDAKEVGEWTIKGSAIRIRSKCGDSTDLIQPGFLSFRLDETTGPNAIDLTEWEDTFDRAAEPYKGIYKFDGDVLTICFNGEPKGSRPTAFKSKSGADHALIVLRRNGTMEERKKRERSDLP
jgi:RNA polymerase sigma factor (sigma-70 family)